MTAAAAVWTAVVAACAGPRPGDEGTAKGRLAIAAASDLRFALPEVMRAFAADRSGEAVEATYGSSGNFVAQLSNGAPFDLFLSADAAYLVALAERGIVERDSIFRYAQGRIVLWVPAASSLEVERDGLHALLDPSVARIAIANPAHAPNGRAAEAALVSAGLEERIRPKLVFGENIAQTLQFVQSGAAQAGIVALSLARAPEVVSTGRYWTIPADLHPPIDQGGGIVAASPRGEMARTFAAFMLSPRGQAVLEQYGFGPPVKD
jgi:molybdate transport system substrate-binding protein